MQILRCFARIALSVVLLFFVRPLGGHADEADMAAGVTRFKSGEYLEAIEIFRALFDEDPSSSEASRNLSHALAAHGRQLIHRGDLEGASERLSEATEILPGEPLFHFLLAAALFRSGDLYGARRSADEALSLDEHHPGAREILGDILYQEGFLNRAIPEWELALERPGGSYGRLKEKISRAHRELDAESGFGRDVSLHFTLQYDGQVQRDVIKEILDQMEEAYDRIGDQLGAYPKGDIPVILYSKILFKDITRSPLWVAGRFDGKIRIPTGGVSDAHDVLSLRPVLAHELAHAFIRNMAPSGLPLWFEEGLAKHFEGFPGDRAYDYLASHASSFPRELHLLNDGLRGGNGSVASAYLASLFALEMIIESDGFWTVRRIIEAVGSGIPFAEAFERETRTSIPEFERRWISQLP